MKLVWRNERYETISRFGEWQAKEAGFRWDPKAKTWWTGDSDKAMALLQFADDNARDRLKGAHKAAQEAREASRATDAQVEVPAPEGLAYLPYQRAGIAYAMQRPATLIGDEMGLGKTIQAIGVINADRGIHRVLVVCPASLRLNWQRELRKWLTRPMDVGIAQPKGNPMAWANDVVIVNYDVLHRYQDVLRAQPWDLLIVDECHYLKNPKARRTAQVLGRSSRDKSKVVAPIPARRRLFLTGTPIVNRPVELHPILRSMDPERWRNWRRFVDRYCGAYEHRFGLDVSGASNLAELQDILRANYMVRRLKADVLTELPPKRRQVIEIPANGAGAVVRREKQVWAAQQAQREELRLTVELAKASEDPDDYRAAVDALRAFEGVAFVEVSKVRRETAFAKAPYVVEHLEEAIAAGAKVVCFAHHLNVIDTIMAAFPDRAVKLDGRDAMETRDVSVQRFQTDDKVRLFVGGIRAAGVGLTLTAAAHVVFAELDWTPGNVSQAEDRCHRIGQANSVLVQHLVLEGSIDAWMASIIVEKQGVIDQVLDLPTEAEEPDWTLPEAVSEEPATKDARSEKLAEEARLLSPEDIATIHVKLRYLASVCDGALKQDGKGFNKFDGRLGSTLARLERLTPKQAALGSKIAHKYRVQLAAAGV